MPLAEAMDTEVEYRNTRRVRGGKIGIHPSEIRVSEVAAPALKPPTIGESRIEFFDPPFERLPVRRPCLLFLLCLLLGRIILTRRLLIHYVGRFTLNAL
jgi:hypothetical protein